jgi:hypothetical protein
MSVRIEPPLLYKGTPAQFGYVVQELISQLRDDYVEKTGTIREVITPYQLPPMPILPDTPIVRVNLFDLHKDEADAIGWIKAISHPVNRAKLIVTADKDSLPKAKLLWERLKKEIENEIVKSKPTPTQNDAGGEPDQAKTLTRKRPPGRPRLTQKQRQEKAEIVKKIERLSDERNISLKQAAELEGTPYGTFKDWRQKYADK